MDDFVQWMFGKNDFPARWACGNWTPLHGWTHIISDLAVWAAYMAIPFILIYFISKRKDFPLPKIFWLFGAFIAACGTVHLLECIIYWVPIYRISAVVKAVTAISSWVTVFALIPAIPYALSLRSPVELEKEIYMRKEAEVKLNEKTKELEKTNEKLERHLSHLKVVNKELDAFSYSVSHDLKSPLRAVNGFSRVLLEEHADKFDEEGKRLLNIVHNNSIAMGRLIDDLLAFSRLGRQEINCGPINMEVLAGEVYEEFKNTMSGRKVHFDLKPLSPAYGDSHLIRQVFINLISNACKYTRTKETATIEVGGRKEKENIYYVKDNGVGFDAQYADKLFGVFQRLHPASEFEGTGVGLAIVARVVHKHGGRVWAEGRVNEGAVFYFTLPDTAVD